MVIRRQPVFIQDKDPKYKSKLCTNYWNQLVQEKILTLMDWSAQSPDLNPIELLWDEIDQYVKKFQVKSEEHLWELLQKAWKAVTIENLNKLIFRMLRICEAVIKKRGGYFDECKEKFEIYQKDKRTDKLNELAKPKKQQNIFHFVNKSNELVVKASYNLAHLIAFHSRPFTEDQFIKNCLIETANILCPEKMKDSNKISFSRNTIAERVNDIAADLRSQLKIICKDVQAFSITVDESTDFKDVAQLSVFIRGCSFKYDITEELLELIPMHSTTTGAGIFLEIEKILDKVASVVNFIRARGLNNHQFASLLNENDSEYEDLLYYTEVRWLSCHKVLKAFNHLKTEIFQFLEVKGQDISDIKNTKFLQDLAFLVDITKHLNGLNIILQGKNWSRQCLIMSELFKPSFYFRNAKLNKKVWISTCPDNVAVADVAINNIKQDFEARFQDFKKREPKFALFTSPLNLNI
ncbi:general transcription factor II-I repeat domain-containing protein 2B-like [Hydra vulgaris]|uniref:General transcription factor II-I repeat domain-containing protein 2B-like n=1 Tax=Hydra vulgaris TaxID=6087 RepID=A0ABM4DHL1_HYDVU